MSGPPLLAEEQPAPRRRKVWPWVVVLVPLALVGTAAVVVALGYLFVATGESGPPTSAERSLLVDLDYVSEWFAEAPAKASGSYLRTRYFDRSFDLDYELDSTGEDVPYIAHSISFERNVRDARAVYLPMWSAALLAMKITADQTITVDEMNEGFSWGDQSRFGVLRADGQAFGNAFVARKDTRVVYFVIAGYYFSGPDDFAAMMLPKLEQLEAHEVESASQ